MLFCSHVCDICRVSKEVVAKRSPSELVLDTPLKICTYAPRQRTGATQLKVCDYCTFDIFISLRSHFTIIPHIKCRKLFRQKHQQHPSGADDRTDKSAEQ